MLHRLLAGLTLALLGGLAWSAAQVPDTRRWAHGFAAWLALQLLTGLSNVLLGWPLLAPTGALPQDPVRTTAF